MSQENVESFRQSLDAFNRRDKRAWLATMHPEAELVPAKEWPENTPISGATAIWDFYVEVAGVWEDGSFELAEIVDSGTGKVVANNRLETRGKASGAGAEFSYWLVGTFRDGRATRIEWFAHRDEALQAAGLSE
jgi:ketosteroid isomerase-like protein